MPPSLRFISACYLGFLALLAPLCLLVPLPRRLTQPPGEEKAIGVLASFCAFVTALLLTLVVVV